MSTDEMTAPATEARYWFTLSRHDDPEGAEPEGTDGGDEDAEAERLLADAGADDPEPEGADKLGDAGKKALDRMKAERAAAKKEAAEAKRAAAEAQRKIQEYEDREKSELEKATTKAERLEAAAAKATARAVKAEVRAAAAEFADPEDAVAFLDLSTYTSDDGDIDTEAISADLADLLERKPHLRRPAAEPPKKPAPKPDPGQGSRGTPPPTDFRTASKEAVAAELAQYSFRQRL